MNLNLKISLRFSIICMVLLISIVFPLRICSQLHGVKTDSGKMGNEILWEMFEDGTVVISGSGDTFNYGRVLPYREILVTKVIVNEGVTSLGKNLFKGCVNLMEVSLPSSLNRIGESVFENCKGLNTIIIPTGISRIETKAFKKCVNLRLITLPEGIEYVGDEAFAECRNLRSISLASSIKKMGNFVFKDSPEIYICENLPDFIQPDNCGVYNLSYDMVKTYRQTEEKKKKKKSEWNDETGSRQTNDNIVADMSEKAIIDVDIPQSESFNENTVAIIIANEHYQELENVAFAKNDGEIFAKYCNMTLGIPDENVRFLSDATYGKMMETISEIKDLARVFKGEMKLIFYYAGHGSHETSTKRGFLIPVDASKVTESTCVSLGNFYQELGDLELASATVFLDACFSGAGRSGEMLLSGRSVREAPEPDEPTGNVVVISSTSNDQIAMPLNKMRHGLFTYYLLKKLNDSKGDMTLVELVNALERDVPRNSMLHNKHEQTPTVAVSRSLGNDWEKWKLNN